MKVIDTFMFNREFDLLECRLYELADAVDYFVIVEAEVDHQDHPKPFHLSENIDRFDQWRDQIEVVRAKGLPTRREDPDPWAREHAQREFVAEGLARLSVDDQDVILHGDVDEIPTAVAARNMRPRGMVSFEQRGHFWSCRWRYPIPWHGTVAGRAGAIRSFGHMRDSRGMNQRIPDAGWHLSWLPDGDMSTGDAAVRKVGSYCHPEVTDRILAGLEDGRFLRDGVHVDNVKMIRCEIDESFPRYVREGRCPESWLL